MNRIVIVLAALCALALGQLLSRENTNIQGSQTTVVKQPPTVLDPEGNVRVELQGRYGFGENALDHDFAGWMTHLATKNLELTHVLARFVPVKATANENARIDQQNERILNMFTIQNHKTGVLRWFVTVQQNEADPGKCHYYESMEGPSIAIGPWKSDTTEKCGRDQNGMIFTRITEINPQDVQTPIEVVQAVCTANKELDSLALAYRIQQRTVFSLEADVVQHLDTPSLKDPATMQEFSIPLICFASSTDHPLPTLFEEAMTTAPPASDRLNNIREQ